MISGAMLLVHITRKRYGIRVEIPNAIADLVGKSAFVAYKNVGGTVVTEVSYGVNSLIHKSSQGNMYI